MSCLAIIPARGGSKRIPRKNIRDFLGKPIIAYSIQAAVESKLFDEIMVSTDDGEIAEIAEKFGAKVPFLRSEEASNDYATTVDVLLEVVRCYQERGQSFDTICCLYSTAPFITPDRLTEAYNRLSDDIDSVFTVVEYSYPIQRSLVMDNGTVAMAWPQYKKSRSQDLEKHYHDAGQFYFAKVKEFLETKSIWGEHTAGLVLSELEVQDLDTITDWQLAEMKYKLLHA